MKGDRPSGRKANAEIAETNNRLLGDLCDLRV